MNSFRNIYNSNLSHRAKSVYMYLKDRADSEGRCWPAIRTIAAGHCSGVGTFPLYGQAGAG